MTCENCGADDDVVIPSPVIPWSGLALCDGCHERYESGDLEVTAEVRQLQEASDDA
jgi:hypothetical protein